MDTVFSKIETTPKRRESLANQIYAELRKRLSRGEIKFGEKLVDVAVADSMGVSRMPVREALSRLVHEGYLIGTSRGYELRRISLEEAAEIFEMRRLLEPRAAGSATPLLTADALSQLARAVEKARATLTTEDPGLTTEALREFRSIWLAFVPNKLLAGAIERFIDQTNQIRRLTLIKPEVRQLAVDLVSALLEAFQTRDGIRAHDCIARQVDAGWESFREFMAADQGEPGAQ